MRCPECGGLMNTSFICSLTGVAVYNCATRGVWLYTAKGKAQLSATVDHSDHYYVFGPDGVLAKVVPVDLRGDPREWSFRSADTQAA